VSVLHEEFATKALASSARGPRPTSSRDQVQLRQNQTRSRYSGTAVTHLPVSPEVLKDIGRAEQCLVLTGATGLQEERLELHEVGAPEAHRAFDVPDGLSQATAIRKQRESNQ
jgi:hypothetical protein